MTEYTVLKPFNTVNRRLAPAEGPAGIVTEVDNLSPFTLDERLSSGFLRVKEEPKPADTVVQEPAPAPAPEPPPADGEGASSRPGRSSK